MILKYANSTPLPPTATLYFVKKIFLQKNSNARNQQPRASPPTKGMEDAITNSLGRSGVPQVAVRNTRATTRRLQFSPRPRPAAAAAAASFRLFREGRPAEFRNSVGGNHATSVEFRCDRRKKVKFVHRRRAKQSFWFRKRSRVHYKQARRLLYLIWRESHGGGGVGGACSKLPFL